MKTPIRIEIPKSLPNQPWHPSVVYIPEGWNGHPYWMAETPLPVRQVNPYLDRWELPCIHFSNDGLTWKSIESNPIDDIIDSQISGHGYLSDPHLLLKDGVLYCYYRMMDNNDLKTTILRKCSRDGVTWSEREVVCSVLSKEREIISPAIVWTGEKYRMYYVDDTYTNLHRGVHYCESENGLQFDKLKQVNFIASNEDTIPWHIDVQKVGNMWLMVIQDVDRNKVEIWKSKDGETFDKQCMVLRASGKIGDFFSKQIYRSCLVPNIENGSMLRLYLSTRNERSRYIGLMESKNDGVSFEWVSCRMGIEYLQFACKIIGEEMSAIYHRLGKCIKKRI